MKVRELLLFLKDVDPEIDVVIEYDNGEQMGCFIPNPPKIIDLIKCPDNSSLDYVHPWENTMPRTKALVFSLYE